MAVHITSKCALTVRDRQTGSTRNIAFDNFNTATAHNGTVPEGNYPPAPLYQGLTIKDCDTDRGTVECCAPPQENTTP